MQSFTASPVRQSLTYKLVDGSALEVDVLGAEPGKSKPCVLWIHGGGLIFGSRKISPRASFAQALLDRGIVVVSVDHRLAPEAKLLAIIEDVSDAWDWLHQFGKNLLGVDPTRLAIAGASAGGYLSLLAGYLFEPRPRALAAFWGFGDITAPWEAQPSTYYRTMEMVGRQEALAALGTQPASDASTVDVDRTLFYLYCRQQGRWLHEVTGHDPLQDASWFERYCPLRNIGDTYPPSVLIHGTEDTDVPHQESENLAQRLAACGVVHQFISLPGIGHGFAGAETEAAQAVEAAAADFLLEHLHPGDK